MSDDNDSLGGFIKGTRVQTRDGLKRIEEVQPGDYVRSSPEDGQGAPDFRPVTRTTQQCQSVCDLSIHLEGWEPSQSFAAVMPSVQQLFWHQNKGWVCAETLRAQQKLRQVDGSQPFVGAVKRVYRTEQDGIGWTSGARTLDQHGSLFDYANYQTVNSKGLVYLSREVRVSKAPFLQVAVFSLEVEEHHTYYVGSGGFWVHDATRPRESGP